MSSEPSMTEVRAFMTRIAVEAGDFGMLSGVTLDGVVHAAALGELIEQIEDASVAAKLRAAFRGMLTETPALEAGITIIQAKLDAMNQDRRRANRAVRRNRAN